MSKKQKSLRVLIGRFALVTALGAALVAVSIAGLRASADQDTVNSFLGYLDTSTAAFAAGDQNEESQQDGARAIYRGVVTAARFDIAAASNDGRRSSAVYGPRKKV